jgi:hypothetical protein
LWHPLADAVAFDLDGLDVVHVETTVAGWSQAERPDEEVVWIERLSARCEILPAADSA